uniref:Transmembrane protein n=1 Tax=Mesocestoides corti TaxID=53468 RepID=A0A5K3FGD8_MESCO
QVFRLLNAPTNLPCRNTSKRLPHPRVYYTLRGLVKRPITTHFPIEASDESRSLRILQMLVSRATSVSSNGDGASTKTHCSEWHDSQRGQQTTSDSLNTSSSSSLASVAVHITSVRFQRPIRSPQTALGREEALERVRGASTKRVLDHSTPVSMLISIVISYTLVQKAATSEFMEVVLTWSMSK